MGESSIKVLDDLTIQKIAAGEVIDNPSSVVKELVENSIDAGSNNIVVEIKKGGKELIRITDDGKGMTKEDIGLAFKRHSTSKLRDVNDIYSITSLGFRGEALASVSSIAKVEVLTKTKDIAAGSHAVIKEGTIKSIDSIGTPKGTTMLIKDIFYNLPVRKKFLKTNRSEANYINNVVNRMALGNPEIGFKFIRDDKLIIQTKSNDSLINTMYTILGKDYASNIIEVDYEDPYIKLTGYISNNQLYRGNRGHQYLYINGRYIVNYAISKAIENRYRTMIPRGRFPAFILNLQIDPGEIDVNIHPTKQEIKFTRPDRVIGTISNRVDDYLKESLNIPKITPSNNEKDDLPNLLEIEVRDERPVKTDKKSETIDEKQDLSLYSNQNKDQSHNFDYLREDNKDDNTKTQRIDTKRTNMSIDEIDISDFFEEIGLSDSSEKEIEKEGIIENQTDRKDDLSIIKDNSSRDLLLVANKDFSEEDNSNLEAEIKKDKKTLINEELLNLKLVGRVFETYIIAEDKIKKSIFFIDQHAAHERIMYERYMDEFKSEKVAIQQLMLPEIVELSYQDMEVYKDNETVFEKLGFDISIFGKSSLSIRGVPLLFGNPESKSMFIDILDNIHEDLSSSYDLKIEKIMKIACVNAIRSGDEMGELEIEALFEQLVECSNPYTCPHGRPTIIEMTKKQLEQDFLRIM